MDVLFDNDFNIVFNNQIEFIENNDFQKWKVLLTAPKGSFFRDSQLGLNFMLLLQNARLNKIESMISFYRGYASQNNIDLLNLILKYNQNENSLMITFYFHFGFFQTSIII